MRRLLLASALALAALAPVAPSALAQRATYCTNCSTRVDQLMQYAREVETLSETITMRIAQARMLENQVRNMVALPGAIWHNIEGNFAATRGLFDRGSHLALNAGMVSSQLRTYREYLGMAVEPQDAYQRWSQQANDTVTASLAGLGLQREQMRSDREIVQAIRARSSGAGGALEAIQANTEMASAQVNELHRLREIMLADAQLNANVLQMQADKEAVGQALHDQFFDVPPAPMAGNRRY